MCGIIGYIGPRPVLPVLVEGLRRLEYRGYDSAGVALVDDGRLDVRRSAGKLARLEEVLAADPIAGSYGLGHTRWATHGRPTEENAHPHRDCTGRLVVVHNGIIENYLDLKAALEAEGHRFVTETDTEIVAHLVEREMRGDGLEAAVGRALRQLRGLFAIVLISADDPDVIVAARNGPPVVVGLGDGEFFVASDIPAILSYTRDVVFLDDGEIAVLTRQGSGSPTLTAGPRVRTPQRVLWDPVMAERAGYKHFMLKEIFEQPRAIGETLVGRLSSSRAAVTLDEIGLDDGALAARGSPARRRVRHELACGAGGQVPRRAAGARARGSGLRVGVSVSRSDRRRAHAHGRHHPVGRNGRHAGGAARGQAQGRGEPGRVQRRRQHGHARVRRRHLHACRPGDRRGVDQGVHDAAGGALPAGPASGTREGHAGSAASDSRTWTRWHTCRTWSSRC